MSKYYVYGTVVGSKYLGEVEADNAQEAKRKGWELDECWVSLCHQCAREIDDPEISKLDVEEVK